MYDSRICFYYILQSLQNVTKAYILVIFLVYLFFTMLAPKNQEKIYKLTSS